jgi:hypothetical protein
MAYLGTPIDTTNQFQSLQGKRFSGNASTTAFTLDVAPGSTLDIEVYVENVRQDPNSSYTLNGTTLTFSAAPPSGTNNIYVIHQAKAVGTITAPVGGSIDMNGVALILDEDGDTSIRADTDDQIDFKTGGTDRATIDSSGNLKYNSGYGSVVTAYGVRAWVNFDGTGTVAIRDSGNVSSITDINTGQFQVNFTTNMPDENYCTTLGARPDGSDTNGRSIIFATPYSTSAVKVGFINAANTGYLDPDIYCVAVIR